MAEGIALAGIRHMCQQFWDFLLRCHFRVQLLVCDCYVIVWTGKNTCKRHRERQHSRSSGALLPCVSLPPLEGSMRFPAEAGFKDSKIQVQASAFPRSIGLEHSEQRLMKSLLSGTSNGQ